jgi:hypothetical protein
MHIAGFEKGGLHFLRGYLLAPVAMQAKSGFVVFDAFVEIPDGDAEMVYVSNHFVSGSCGNWQLAKLTSTEFYIKFPY